MKIWLAGAIFLLLIGTAFAGDLKIEQVLFDPGSESGGEFVRIYNDGLQDVNLSGYLLKTETSDIDVTLPGEILTSGSYYLITDNNWDTEKDNESWPDADYKEDMTLKNSNDGVALMFGDEIIDAVGWGEILEIEEGLSEGIPFFESVLEGEALIRTQDSGNNSLDFIKGNVSFEEVINENENVEIFFNINNSVPSILEIMIQDDLDDEGIQILPAAGQQRMVSINITVEDSDGDNLESYVLINGQQFNLTNLSGEFVMNYFDAAGTYEVEVVIADGSETVNTSVSFEYLELVSLGLDAESLNLGEINKNDLISIEGDLDWETLDKPTLKNLGNVALDVGLGGSDFVDGGNSIGIESLSYSLGEENGILNNELQVVSLGIAGGGLKELSFGLELPQGISKGNYKGSVSVVGVVA